MSGLEFNKIAGAVLLAGLIAMLVGHTTRALYMPAEHEASAKDAKEEKRGFKVEVAESATAGSGATAAVEDKAPDIMALLAKANVDAGKDVAKKCQACHSMEKGGANKVGPYLWGVVGGPKGSRAQGFAYSDALAGKKSEKWDYHELNNFLYNPKKAVPGTKMAFAGIKKPDELANLIAYLRTLNDNPPALP